MPITQSAKKALRQNARRRTINLARKETYKRAVKEFRRLVAAKKFEEAAKFIPDAHQALDKAAKTGVIKNNKSSRLKSRLAQLMAKSTRASS